MLTSCIFCFIVITVITEPVVPGNSDGYIKDLTCIVYNWKIVVCTWKLGPVVLDNHVELFWKPRVDQAGWYRCPSLTDTSCTWNVIDDRIDLHRNISISLNGTGFQLTYLKNWNTLVYPDPVFDQQVNAVNQSCVLVKWKHNDFIHNKTYRIVVNDRDRIITLFSADDSLETTICDLMAFKNYTFTIECKPVSDGHWSRSVVTSIRTHKAAPVSQNLRIVGFSWRKGPLLPTTILTLYWQPLDRTEWNSDRLHYRTFLVSSTGRVFPKQTGDFYATFEVNSNYSYRGELFAFNDIGNSTSISVNVPSYQDASFIEEFVAIIDEDHIVHVSWNRPLNSNKTRIYWCHQQHTFNHICKETPSNVEVNGDITEYKIQNVPDDKATYMFGASYITANNHTPGFIWSDCIFKTSQEFPIRLKVTTVPMDNTVMVKWELPRCNYHRIRTVISVYIVQVCADANCTDYQEYQSSGNSLLLNTSTKTVCVRVFPKWNNTDGKTASIDCVGIPHSSGLITVVILVLSILVVLPVFGCFIITRKLCKVMRTASRPYVIEVPHVNCNEASGIPLMDSGISENVTSNDGHQEDRTIDIPYVT